MTAEHKPLDRWEADTVRTIVRDHMQVDIPLDVVHDLYDDVTELDKFRAVNGLEDFASVRVILDVVSVLHIGEKQADPHEMAEVPNREFTAIVIDRRNRLRAQLAVVYPPAPRR